MLRLPTALKSLEYISCLHYADCVTDLIHLNSSLRDNHQVAGIMLLTGSLAANADSGVSCLGLGVFSKHQRLFTNISQEQHLKLADLGLRYESPFSWETARRSHADSDAWNLFDSGLQQAGLHAGYSMCTQINERDEVFLGAHLACTTAEIDTEQASLYEYIMPYLARTAAKHWLFNDDLLTLKQKEIIECLNQGMDESQTARLLKIPTRAVRFHLRKICDMTETDSIEEALALLGQLSIHSRLPPVN